MTARIGYLSALTGDDGHSHGRHGYAASGDGHTVGGNRRVVSRDLPSARDGSTALRPPRRLLAAADFSEADPGFPEAPGFGDDPSIIGTPDLSDEQTAQLDASGTRVTDAHAGHATSGLHGRPGLAPHPEPRPGRAALGPTPKSSASGPEPHDAASGPEFDGAASGLWPGQAAATASDRSRASENGADDAGRQLVPARVDMSSTTREYLVTDPDKAEVARSGAAAGARVASIGVGDGGPVAPGQARHDPMSVGWGRADVSAQTELEENPLSPPHTVAGPRVAGHQPALDRAGGSASANQGPARRAPGEPWRIPRLRLGQSAGDGTVASAMPPRPGTAVSGREATAAPSGTSHSVQRSPHDPAAGPPPTRHGTGSPSAPPHADASAAGTAESSVTPPGASPPLPAAGEALGGNTTRLSGDRSSPVALSDARTAAQPQVPGTRRPGATGSSPLLPPGARHPGDPLTATSNPGSPFADSLLPGPLADARAQASALSAAVLPAASTPAVRSPAAPIPAAQPPAALLPAVRPSAAQSPAAPFPAAQMTAASPPAARTSSAPPSAASLIARETSPPSPVADRAQGQLTPAGHSADHSPDDRAEAPASPPTPTLSIGTIEVTLLPPPHASTPARPARREPPQRLSRGLGPRFGQGQA